MVPKEHGFTLIEIVVVMLLISIVSATVFTRSITTVDINLRGRAEKVQNHIRYAQSMALKTNKVWGIASIGPQYWMFSGNDFNTGIKKLPGEETDKIFLDGSGVDLNNFFLFFDEFGKPYKIYTDAENNVPVAAGNSLTITITSEEDLSINRKLSITPETGLIVVIP